MAVLKHSTLWQVGGRERNPPPTVLWIPADTRNQEEDLCSLLQGGQLDCSQSPLNHPWQKAWFRFGEYPVFTGTSPDKLPAHRQYNLPPCHLEMIPNPKMASFNIFPKAQ